MATYGTRTLCLSSWLGTTLSSTIGSAKKISFHNIKNMLLVEPSGFTVLLNDVAHVPGIGTTCTGHTSNKIISKPYSLWHVRNDLQHPRWVKGHIDHPACITRSDRKAGVRGQA